MQVEFPRQSDSSGFSHIAEETEFQSDLELGQVS